jgi:GNAT superfamily N-acetyltransferase
MTAPTVEQPRVRPATTTDADGIWPLVSAFATSFTPDRDAFANILPALLARNDVLVLVAESFVAETAGDVAGYLLAALHPTFFANGPVAGVQEVMVAPAHRRTGVGAALMAAAEEWADARGARYVSLASRRAGEFYLALGYEDSATFYKKSSAQRSDAQRASDHPA